VIINQRIEEDDDLQGSVRKENVSDEIDGSEQHGNIRKQDAIAHPFGLAVAVEFDGTASLAARTLERDASVVLMTARKEDLALAPNLPDNGTVRKEADGNPGGVVLARTYPHYDVAGTQTSPDNGTVRKVEGNADEGVVVTRTYDWTSKAADSYDEIGYYAWFGNQLNASSRSLEYSLAQVRSGATKQLAQLKSGAALDGTLVALGLLTGIVLVVVLLGCGMVGQRRVFVPTSVAQKEDLHIKMHSDEQSVSSTSPYRRHDGLNPPVRSILDRGGPREQADNHSSSLGRGRRSSFAARGQDTSPRGSVANYASQRGSHRSRSPGGLEQSASPTSLAQRPYGSSYLERRRVLSDSPELESMRSPQ
jgi:hypothetical protein